MRRNVRLSFDSLEDRQVPAVFGVPWTDPMHLSVSFTPDGTSIDGTPSTLTQTMQRLDPTGLWKRDILRAIQAWSNVTNVNIGVVADNGAPLGALGAAEGNTNFGTLRIAAKPLSGNVLAIGIPPDVFSSGTWTGEIIVNSNADLAAQKTDIYTVFLHEVGHALGFPGSTDPASVMYQLAQGKKTGLASSDVLTATRMYGTRAQDVNDADKNNGIMKEATRIRYEDDGPDAWTGTTPVVAYGDITKTTDVDYYSFRNIDGYRGPVTFRVLTDGISLLNPKITLLDANGRVLATKTAAGKVGGADLSITLPKTTRTTYYLKVERASTTELFGIGRFGVAVTLDARLQSPLAETNAVLRGPYETLDESDLKKLFTPEAEDALFEVDDHTDDAIALAERMTAVSTLGATFQTFGSIQDATDVDYHRARTPRSTTSGTLTTATITITPFETNGVMPAVQLVNGSGVSVPLSVLTNGNGVMVLQGAGLRSDTDYYVRVSNVPGQAITGNYTIQLRYGAQATTLESFATGTATPAGATQTLYVAEPQLFHMLLSTNGAPVTMTIRNAANAVVYTLTSNGPPASAAPLLLQPGEYHIQFTTTAASATFELKGLPLSDPIGAVVINPTLSPPYQTPGTPGTNTYPNGTVTTKPYLFSSVVL